MKTSNNRPVKFFVVLLVLVLALAGCTGGDGESAKTKGTADAGDADGSGTTPASDVVAVDAQPARDALIYAATLERLVRASSTGQGDPPFNLIFVLDGVVPHAAEPTAQEDPEEPFSQVLKDDLQRLATRRELPPLEFVPTRESAVVGTDSGKEPGQARDGGAVVSLGAIEGSGQRVEVETSLWVNGLWGTWQTYVVAEKGGAWKVTGTTGPTAIS
jgi:hypothetical protein